MPRMLLAALGLASTLALAACTPSGMDMTASASSPADNNGGSARYRLNPAPKTPYRITMTIKDAPGPFRWIRPIAHYDVVNRECLSPPKDNPGGHSAPVPTAPTDFKLEQTAAGVYTGVVYADLMQDEDYTGNGVCHWELTSIVVQLKATGAGNETLFVPAIPERRLALGGIETVYFNKLSYPRLAASRLDEPVDTGDYNRSGFGPSIRDEDLFTITFAIGKDAAP